MRALSEGQTLGTITLLSLTQHDRSGRRGWLTQCRKCGYVRFRDNVYLSRDGYIPQCEHCVEQETSLPMYVVLDGQRMSLRDVSRHTGIPLNRIEKRYKKRVRQRLAGVLNPVMDTDHWVIFGRKPKLPQKRVSDVVIADFYTPLVMQALASEYTLTDTDCSRLTMAIRKALRTPFPTDPTEEETHEHEHETTRSTSSEDIESYDFFDA